MSLGATMDGTGLFDGLQWGWRRRLPVILQTEAAECGLASLAMIARYHGHDVDLPSLRRKHSTSLKGANLARVMELAAQLGFETRPLRLELDELPELKTPCILHWDLNHFVVLKWAGQQGAVIHDPARGVRKLSNAEISKHFTGVALECTPSADFKPVKARESISLRALTGKIKGLPRALIQIFALALALEVFALVGPFYMQWVLDQVLVSADKSLLALLGIGFIAVVIFQTAISAVRSWTVTWFGVNLSLQWVNNLGTHAAAAAGLVREAPYWRHHLAIWLDRHYPEHHHHPVHWFHPRWADVGDHPSGAVSVFAETHGVGRRPVRGVSGVAVGVLPAPVPSERRADRVGGQAANGNAGNHTRRPSNQAR
jgi:hypothetical protein